MTYPRFFTPILALCAFTLSGCLPTVNKPLTFGKPANGPDLNRFAGDWKVDKKTADIKADTVRIMVEGDMLIFMPLSQGKGESRFPVSVRQLTKASYILNLDTSKIDSADDSDALPTRPGEPRYAVALADVSRRNLVLHFMNEDAVLKDIRENQYTGKAWNICLDKPVTRSTATRPPPTVWEPCYILTPTTRELNNYIASRGKVIFANSSQAVLFRE
jgi:hypothetical protein